MKKLNSTEKFYFNRIYFIVLFVAWFLLPVGMNSLDLFNETSNPILFYGWNLPLKISQFFYSPILSVLFYSIYFVPLAAIFLLISIFIKKISERIHLTQSPFYVESQMFDENLFQMENKVLEGYWACEAYYADIMKELQKKLEFPEIKNSKNIRMKEMMEQINSISIHIRRGDYLTEENQRMFGGICTEEYYESAIEYMRERIEDIRFFVFSDDPVYARKKYPGKEFTIVDINHGKDSFWDMHLMSCCKHNICANSTFSFWGARLNSYESKIVVRPLKQKNCDWYVPEKMKQLWRGWMLIEENGNLIQ